jgi:UDP-galactopyranose mutase
MVDYLVVGAGLFGSVFAHEAKRAGRSVLVIEKRDHIGGNCFSYDDGETGVNIHKYGTHIFHDSSKDVCLYINRFTDFNRYQHRVLTTCQGKVYSMPINLATINQFYGLNLKPYEVAFFLSSKIPSFSAPPANLEDKAVSLIGRDLYEAFIKHYTRKQWNCDPKELPAEVITRLPIRDSYFDSYFDDTYQGIPLGGYTPIFEGLLKDIPVELNTDFFDNRQHWRSMAKTIVYTGPIDRYYDYRFGRLRWRSVRFEMERPAVDDYQGTSVMNYADGDVPYTRIHEPKHLHREKKHRPGTTVIIREYSCEDPDEPYYPVNLKEDRAMLARYQSLQAAEPNVIFGGRLAEYKYYDMHHVIASALGKSSVALSG